MNMFSKSHYFLEQKIKMCRFRILKVLSNITSISKFNLVIFSTSTIHNNNA